MKLDSNKMTLQRVNNGNTPKKGFDLWHAFEFSWLNENGKPKIAYLQIKIPVNSPRILQAVALKAYLNDFAMQYFTSEQILVEKIKSDLAMLTQSKDIDVSFYAGAALNQFSCEAPIEFNLNQIRIHTNQYKHQASLLKIDSDSKLDETIYYEGFRFCDASTGQPYWATLVLALCGKPINKSSLLAYLISFRQTLLKPESCADLIMTDLLHLDSDLKIELFLHASRKGGLAVDVIRGCDFYETPFKRHVFQ